MVIDFAERAFGGELMAKLDRTDGSIMHAEVRIGDSYVMMGEPMQEYGAMPSSLYLYFEDCDAVYERAIEAGGTSVLLPTDMEHAGERYGGVRDGQGNIWWIATHKEAVSQEEAQRRIRAMGL